MPRVKKIIQARDGGPIPVAYSEVEVGGETVLAPVVVLEAGAQVQLSGSTARGGADLPAAIAVRHQPLAAGATHDHELGTKAVVIDDAMFIATHKDARIILRPRDKAGAFQDRKIANATTLGVAGNPRLDDIYQGSSLEWEITVWDTERPFYKAVLRRPLVWPFGGVIRIQNSTGDNISAATLVVSYRELTD